MSIRIRKISLNDIHLIKLFLQNAGTSLNTFRYYDKRPLDIVSEHVYTIILLDGELPIGYGHLDNSDKKSTVWLGIALAEQYLGKGLGSILLNNLIEEADKLDYLIIQLTVDSENIPAIRLYEKFGFKILEEINSDKKIFLMLRKNG